ncbi:MAG: DUF4252 domain-containing protein [Bacteroidales bacterium]|nr:DUF4252 domain-containing protein [Bacteroidales bacterium]
MKKAAVLIVFVLVPFIMNGQSQTIDAVIDKYSGQEGVTVVNISPELFQVMSGMKIEQIEDAEVPFDKLSEVKILSIENQALLAENDFFAEVTDGLNTSEFVEIMTVKDGDENIRMWMKNEGRQIRDFLLVVSSPDEGVVVYIKGDFNMNDIEGLAESFGDIEDLEIN